jgi:hypothetical protein
VRRAAKAERIVKRLFGLGGIFLMLLAAQAALAQHGQERGRFAPSQAQPAPKPAPVPVQQISAQSSEGPRGGRLTLEERQQLRRDVNNHGREIYRDRAGPKRSQ